jgi:protein-L-isoaspartate(D-aspartate) O-methyltransferase
MDSSLAKSREKLFRSLRSRIRSKAVIEAMEWVARERFVPPDRRHLAYQDVALGIGEGQTISQPYIVALMLEALDLRGYEKVLEVGTGSGYQAAVLSHLVPHGSVFTVELVPVLAQRAAEQLRELGHNNITVLPAGPVLGCPEHRPFDAIVVAAASPKLPKSLASQLSVGGRMIIPVGTLDQQELVFALRTDEGLTLRMLGPCRFVPLLGPEGFPSDR